MHGSNLGQAPLINFGLIRSLSVVRVSLFCALIKAVKNNFQEKETSHKCSTLVIDRLFVAAAATIKNLTSGQLKTRSSYSFLFDQIACMI